MRRNNTPRTARGGWQVIDFDASWITTARLKPEQFLFPSRVSKSPHMQTVTDSGLQMFVQEGKHIALPMRHAEIDEPVALFGRLAKGRE